MAKVIRLTQGFKAIVDDEDFKSVSQHRWKVFKVKGVGKYAARSTRTATILMHRQIMNEPVGLEVDHKNRNGFDNRRNNLRLATRSQNATNQAKWYRESTTRRTKYKGIHWVASRNKWHVQISEDGRVVFLGRFSDEIEAAKAYDRACHRIRGRFAVLNFSKEASKNDC